MSRTLRSVDAAGPATILFVATPSIARQRFRDASSGIVLSICVASIAEALDVAASLEPDLAVVLLSELDGSSDTFVEGLHRSAAVADLPVITVNEADRTTFKRLLGGLVSTIPSIRQKRATTRGSVARRAKP